MKILIEGWRRVPHSYAIVAGGIGAELARRPDLQVVFREVPYFFPEIEPAIVGGDKCFESPLLALPAAAADESADVTLRFQVPLNLAGSLDLLGMVAVRPDSQRGRS